MVTKKKTTKTTTKKTIIRLIDAKGKHKTAKKGLYVYIREQGKSYRHKIREGETLEDTLQRHKHLHPATKIRIPNYKKLTPKQYQAKIRQKPPIERTLKKGIKWVTINNIQDKQPNQIQKQIKKLFSTIVKDEQLLQILTTNENLKKIKSRLDYKITLKGTKGEQLGEITTHNELPTHLLEKIKKHILKGQQITEGSPKRSYEAIGNYQYQQKGILKTANLRITFRKK